MGDLLDEDDALDTNNILYRCWDILIDCKAALSIHLKRIFRHQVVVSEGHEENEGSVNECDAHSCKTKAE